MTATPSGPGLAQLPMYDWPEIAPTTDALWAAIRDALRQRGISAPTALDRSHPVEDGWCSARLVLSQTCGLPLVHQLSGQVQVLGSFAYEGARPAGNYHSVIITHAGHDERLISLRGKRVVINSDDSYSGCLALKCLLASFDATPGFFNSVQVSGSHRESIRAVVAGSADVAAIDCISWQLAQRYEPDASKLRVIAQTPSRPGLPLITARRTPAGAVGIMREAIAVALTTLDSKTAAMTGISGFLPRDETDYSAIARDLQCCGAIALHAGS